MELLNHLNHPHPLVLSEEKYSDTFECKVCGDCVVGLCYFCNECAFVVHKWCADLPLELTNHPLHLDHPRLVLLSPEETVGDAFAREVCTVCKVQVNRKYGFCCEKCSFVLHPACAFLKKQLEFEYNDADSLPARKCLRHASRLGLGQSCNICKELVKRIWLIEKDDDENPFHFQCALLPKTVKHDRHIHDLTLHVPIEKEKSYYGCVCDLCEEDRDLDQWLYYCARCEVAGHLSCGLLGSVPPNKGILTSNRVYTVEKEEPQVVHDWEKYVMALERRGKTAPGDMEPLGELVHFSHEHPLFLHDDVWDAHNKCRACKICIYGKTYVCADCKFFLHKWCAELPKEVHFGFHLEHPLTLLSTYSSACLYCKYEHDRFSFCCLECDFGVHTTCAFLIEFSVHKSHSHPLQVFWFPTTEYVRFRRTVRHDKLPPCSACLFPCHGMSLGCEECGFYIHIGCSLYPPTGKAETHRHNLNLTYSYEEDPNYDDFICDACEESRTPNRWVYCCPNAECAFVSHLDCSVANLFPKSSCEKEKDANDWVYYRPSPSLHLRYGLEAPRLDQPIKRILKSDKVYAFLSGKVLEDKPKVEELQHFSHEHPLVLSNEKWNAAVRCEACSIGIYGKTYSCHECGYYLHKLCAQIPREVHFRFHPEHPLTLLPNHAFECSVCKVKNSGFSFSCEICDFEAHALCALMPDRDVESHEHPINIVFNKRKDSDPITTCAFPVTDLNALCDACLFPCEGVTIECRPCCFHLHVGCAWYPRTSKTKWHMHAITPEDHHFRVFCDVCYKPLPTIANPVLVIAYGWGYICPDEKYNTTAHLDCAVPNLFLTSSFESILVHQDE